MQRRERSILVDVHEFAGDRGFLSEMVDLFVMPGRVTRQTAPSRPKSASTPTLPGVCPASPTMRTDPSPNRSWLEVNVAAGGRRAHTS
ncbi:hypothetical protein [Gordonia mangrovi]|uniref:hypothetical protein n=1 Tax=Gordonia mangrovi TaxID=2665643 RepID=UPI001F165CD6|nr:hypothetical protein [Gordonia mangrovi]UVF80234.1 hypothetical protein NWF22_10580 [Gordonia mangrovi]